MNDACMFDRIMTKKQEQRLLEDGQIQIKEDFYNFNNVLLFEDSIKVELPQEFRRLSKENADQKYPYLQRPEVIYSNTDGEIAIAFDLTDTEVSDGDLLDFALGMRSSTKKMNPANTFYELKSEGKAAWFDFLSYAIDGKLYNVIFVVNVADRLLFGSFSCPFHQKNDYELFAKRIILSVTPAESEVKAVEI